MSQILEVSAIVLAAGLSCRMGRPKMALPWGGTTVVGQVVQTLGKAGVETIWVVTGGARAEVEASLAGLPVQLVHNPAYADGEMTRSLQVGLAALAATSAQAALVTLGDQPQMQVEIVQSVLQAALLAPPETGLVVPSCRMRRGHPWLAVRRLWPALLALSPPATLRDFLNAYQAQIHYLPVESDTVLQDLDTPAEYDRFRAAANQPPGGSPDDLVNESG